MYTLEWLLEPVNPSVRYLTLVGILGQPPDSPEARDARAQVMSQGPIPRILARQRSDGHFPQPRFAAEHGAALEAFGYRPKYKATTWQLLIFAELGAGGEHPGVRAACEYVLSHCWLPSGLFGMEGEDRLAPCFQGNMVWALARLGHARDARVLEALDLLLECGRFDDGGFKTPAAWPYRGRRDRCSSSHSCYAGCFRALRAAALYGPGHSRAAAAFIDRGVDFFLRHRVMHSSHRPTMLLRREITQLRFPAFVYPDFLDILGLLASLGCRGPELEPAVETLLSRRQPSGCWPLDIAPSGLITVLESPGPESRWTTYRAVKALRALGRLEEADRGAASMEVEVEPAGILAEWLGPRELAGEPAPPGAPGAPGLLRLGLPAGARARDALEEVLRRCGPRLPASLRRGGPEAACAALAVVNRRTGATGLDEPLAPGDRLLVMLPLAGGGGRAPGV